MSSRESFIVPVQSFGRDAAHSDSIYLCLCAMIVGGGRVITAEADDGVSLKQIEEKTSKGQSVWWWGYPWDAPLPSEILIDVEIENSENDMIVMARAEFVTHQELVELGMLPKKVMH